MGFAVKQAGEGGQAQNSLQHTVARPHDAHGMPSAAHVVHIVGQGMLVQQLFAHITCDPWQSLTSSINAAHPQPKWTPDMSTHPRIAHEVHAANHAAHPGRGGPRVVLLIVLQRSAG